mgnify:CR=1 FL=1
MTIAPIESRKIQMKSIIENVQEVEELINSIFEENELSPDYNGNMLVALSEAVNNDIKHGNKLDTNENVDISFDHRGDDYQFTITDEGDGFDYSQLPDPTSPENIEKPEGRGIFIMNHLADEVTFENGGRSVQLLFKAF